MKLPGSPDPHEAVNQHVVDAVACAVIVEVINVLSPEQRATIHDRLATIGRTFSPYPTDPEGVKGLLEFFRNELVM